MALINCTECGREISDAATVCPHCGAPVVKDVFCPTCGAEIARPAVVCNNRKDKLVAGLLAIFLGGLGIHYFYLGKTTAGLITILLSLCTCGGWYIIVFIQGIVMLTMQEDVFYERYVDNDRTFPLF